MYGKEITTINSTVPVVEGGRTIAAVEVAKDITNIRSMSDTILKLQEKKIEPHKVKPKIRQYTFDNIIGNNPQFVSVLERAKRAADNDASVFIYGETGTGKRAVCTEHSLRQQKAEQAFSRAELRSSAGIITGRYIVPGHQRGLYWRGRSCRPV